jgi:dodecin
LGSTTETDSLSTFPVPGGDTMSVAKIIEISAQSGTSFEDAVKEGIARASKTIDNIQGAWIKEMQVAVEDGRVTGYRVNMNVTFVLTD